MDFNNRNRREYINPINAILRIISSKWLKVELPAQKSVKTKIIKYNTDT